MPKVKICGITNREDALFCSQAGADALGFIFWEKSPRCVSLKVAKKIIGELDPFVLRVGVFVNEDREKVLDIASGLNLDMLQFHGKESPSYCNFFKSKFKLIKTFFPEEEKISKVSRYKVNAYLFDVSWEKKVRGKKTISQKLLKEISTIKHKLVILSGGLNPQNIAYVLKKIKPYAVDVASGVEAFPGKKDKGLVKRFIKTAKGLK